MNEHPTAATLERFSCGACTAAERHRVMDHLLLGCTSCGSSLRDLLNGRPARPHSEHLEHLEAAFDRVFSRVRREIPARDRALSLLSILMSLPAERQLALVAEAPEMA